MRQRWHSFRHALERRIRYRVTRRGLWFLVALAVTALAAVVSANNLLFLVLAAMLATLLISGLLGSLALAGLEVDFVPGREDRTQSLIERCELDYVVGSVHFLGDLAVDFDRFDIWEGARSAEDVWRRYFETLAAAASSGMFDILAHPDLVKMWGAGRPTPPGDPRRYYEPALEAIAESGIAVEVSTAGLRKPVGEIYPAPAFLAGVVEAGAPIALSSDAHVPEHIGYAYDQALELLASAGVRELAVFERRERRLEPLGR